MARQLPRIKQISQMIDRARNEKITIDSITLKMGNPNVIFIN